ncbi:hypothetical protein ELG63_36275 [Rhizobium leguminosarum]|uniref:hypothetical protein n=1 Tax=Rhizobium leguminosarum TaxID=384 RepID=UPI00103123FE|nr:hypothetical protein [Rhizobium leguminosarum]TBH28146.1 hypothetical protein ELG63_36275 [Rhizobium leguminosarum]
MNRQSLTLLAASILLASPVSAVEGKRPAFVGSYSYQGPCAAEYQCALEIAPGHRPQPTDTVLVMFIIADRLNYSDIRKSIPLYMRNTRDGRLVAGLAGYVIEISRQHNGDVIVSGLPERNGVSLAGTYSPIGD